MTEQRTYLIRFKIALDSSVTRLKVYITQDGIRSLQIRCIIVKALLFKISFVNMFRKPFFEIFLLISNCVFLRHFNQYLLTKGW